MAVPGAIAAVQGIHARTMFPERKADWRVYPDNLGHKDWPGCFRCHDDKHQDARGRKVRASDCSSCHTLLAQGSGPQLEGLHARGLEFKHPGGDLDPELSCVDCHNGVQK
ncbi:MAG: cytochrome c3 family protein [Verrucomicrobiota bacterium]